MPLTMRTERLRRGWTQAYVAETVGVTLTAIQKIETGRRKPSYDVLCKLEDLFGLNHRDLFKVSGDGTSTA
nr:MAG TPA: Helix-turn-helix XRE-family like protein [Caudoviricetes sp.]